MPKRISKTEDINEAAFRILSDATADKPSNAVTGISDAISRVMAEMGRKGGKIGGKRSLETMSKAERKERAQQAAKVRWKKAKKKKT